jgi:RNA polymerase sigma-70 factor (ECF subfamily)
MRFACLIERMDKDESAAIQRVLSGDRESYRVLMEPHYPVAYRLAFRITGNAEDAEEAAQDAFFRAYRKLSGFRGDSNFSTWVNRIAMNSAFNIVERRSRDVGHTAERLDVVPESGSHPLQVPSGDASPERVLLNAESSRLRRIAMDGLTPMERTAFTLRHMEDLPIAEIAETLRVPTNSAKQAVFRAVSKLRAALAPVAGGMQ